MITHHVEVVDRGFLSEIEPLVSSHYEEFSGDASFTMAYDLYEELYSLGKMEIFTAREEGRVIGYLAIIIGEDHKIGNEPFASEEGFYVKPEYRNQGLSKKILKFAEEYCSSELGLSYILVALPVESSLLTSVGYNIKEYVHIKRLK